MVKKLRIAILVYVLLFVAIGQYLTLRTATGWDRTLWVDAWLLNADGATATTRYLEQLPADALDGIDAFLAAEAARYGLAIADPLQISVAGTLPAPPPELPAAGNVLETIWWSLSMRWFTARLHWNDDRPTPDITLYLNYHSGEQAVTLDRSAALRKAMIAVANVFADRHMSGSNDVVIAHELLHLFGASDKYAAGTNQPLYPIGYAEPDRQPLHPQGKAELMAGRIPLDTMQSRIPRNLGEAAIGPATAFEIGWDDAPAAAPR